MTIRVTPWGVRGSTTNTSAVTREFGGDTACFQLETDNRTVIFDAGSGIVALGQKLVATKLENVEIDLFLSHFHYDHIVGLPFFAPLFDKRFKIRIWAAESNRGVSINTVLNQLFSAPFCPITRDMFLAEVTTQSLKANETLQLNSGVTVHPVALRHPGGNTGFRVSCAGKIFAYTGDFEPDGSADDTEALSGLLNEADLALIDCTYTPENYAQHKGYGHPHWEMVGTVAAETNIKQWFGIHHQHLASDKALSEIEIKISAQFPNGQLARQGQSIKL